MFNNYIKKEKKSFDEYWEEVGRYFGIKDTIEYLYETIDFCEDEHELIIFKNSVGCPLSVFDIDTGTAYYW